MGTCIYNNNICLFKGDCDYVKKEIPIEDEEYDIIYTYEVYSLNIFEKIKWLYKQKMFEWCVGYHFTYTNNRRLNQFYYRNPKWFYKLIFKWYF